MTLQQIRRLHAFHRWATDRVLAALGTITPAQLDKPCGGSFATGRGLLRHVLGAEQLWFERWNGTSPRTLPDYPLSFAAHDFHAHWLRLAEKQQRFMEALTVERLAEDLTYVNIKGETWTYPFADVLLHCVNHGTYHRGQLAHLLRDLGLSAPSTDFLIYADEHRG